MHVHAWPSDRPTRLADALYLWRLISRYKPDCLIANFAPVNWMCIVGWLRCVPCRVAWYHTLATQIARDTHLSRRKLKILRLRKRFVYRRATHLAVNSRAALEDAGRTFGIPPQKCRIWHNALADPLETLGTQFGENRENVVVCAGRFHPTKGQRVLIEALGLCGAQLGETQFEFLGDGPLLDSIRQLAAANGSLERCIFRGLTSQNEVLRRMASALLTVVPSTTEAFGLVNLESMAVGTPVLASGVDGICEIVRDGVDGMLVPPENPAALADALVRLLGDSSLRCRMGGSGRDRFLREFQMSAVVASQADWLEGIVNTGFSTK
jgi:glycosyltransferase involved in cell wall biosynthesis